MPKRIQRKRAKGWVMPANAVYVGRPTEWGNPFQHDNPEYAVKAYRRYVLYCLGENLEFGWITTDHRWITKQSQLPATVLLATTYCKGEHDGRRKPLLFRPYEGFEEPLTLVMLPKMRHRTGLDSLWQFDLACWCPLDQPCHADVLLELANTGR